jgi:hypothetical protein
MWSALAKLALGFFLAIAIIAGGSYLVARQVIAQLTAPPPKPMFPNDNPTVRKALKAPKPSPSASASPGAVAKPVSSPTPSPSPSPASSPIADSPARVKLRRGLNLRESPSRKSAKLGGITYNQKITVLEESPDKQWVRIRVEGSGKEGWVFAAHLDRAE